MWSRDQQYYGKYYEFSFNHMYVSTPTDLIDSLNEEIYNYIPDEKKKRREIFSLKNGKVWLSFNDDCYYTVILRSTTLLLLGAATKTDPTAAICVARSKPAKSFVRDGKTYHFAPEYDNVLNSRCPGIDFFKNQPKIPVIDNFLVYCSLIVEQHVGGERERERERERENPSALDFRV